MHFFRLIWQQKNRLYNGVMKEPKVALIHDNLVQNGGAEKTLELISKIFPNAPIYTGIYKPDHFTPYLNSRKIIHIKNALLQKLPKYFSPIMPLVFENYNLRDFDIILSDSSCWAKGVLTRPDQLHISYIHTPPRFLYHYSVESTKRNAWYFKPVVPFLDMLLRAWDYSAAQRPNYLIANSIEVQKRIKKFYGRESTVINPPIETGGDPVLGNAGEGEYYFAWGRVVAYKNFDAIVKAFNINGLPLIISGAGPQVEYLKSIAKDNVKIMDRVWDDEKYEMIKKSLGVINAVKDEDFGIVPPEAMAFGKPVLVHKSGGHSETVIEGVNGEFFEDPEPEEFSKKIVEFDKNVKSKKYDPIKVSESVKHLSAERFTEEYKSFVMEKWELHQRENA